MFTKTHLYLLMLLVLSVFVVFIACSKTEEATEHADHEMTIADADESESFSWNKVCPVCGGPVTADLETVTYEGKVYGFGCAGCPEKFEEKPQDYVKNLSEDGTEFIGG